MERTTAVRQRPLTGGAGGIRLRRAKEVALAWVVALGSAQAGEVWLQDGGHLVGEVSRAEGHVIVRTASLGELRVSEAHVLRVEEDPPRPDGAAAPLPPPEPQPAPPPPAPEPAPPPPAAAPKPPPWSYHIEAGYFNQSVNVVTRSLSLSASAQRTVGKNAYSVSLRRLEAKSGAVQSEERDELNARWRREMSARLFVQEVTSYVRDGIRGIKAQYEQTVDTGYRVVQRPRFDFSMGLGLVGQHREVVGQPGGTGFLGQIFGEMGWQINERFRFTLSSRFQSLFNEYGSFPNTHGVPVNGSQGRYFYQFNAALSTKVTERISAGVRHEGFYDTTIADPSLRRDRRFTFNLGLNF